MVDREGPTQALREIQKVLRTNVRLHRTIELREVLVVGQHDRRLEFLRGVPRTGRYLPAEPIPVERTVAGGQFVEAAYVYRNSAATIDAEKVVIEATKQASALLNTGQTPRIVEIGREQNAALRRGGHTGDTLVLAAPVGP